MDGRLDFKHHIVAMSLKMSRAISVLYKLRHYIDEQWKLRMHNILWLRHLIYIAVEYGALPPQHH